MIIKKTIIYKYFFILILILILFIYKFIIKNIKNQKNENIISDKWIVIAVFNPPILSLINTLITLKSWKTVIISCKKSIDNKWENLNFTDNIIYLSIKEQKKLNYKIINYLNSYSRKNIGYLYAINHGAKEIYEIDEDMTISNTKILNNINYQICYGINNYSGMINPYNYFGKRNIWPRGFKIKDIGKQYNNKYKIININQTILRPLIVQGLINGIPDIDSILFQTIIKKNGIINYIFSDYCPLLYLPGNYIPINSRNTKYSYEIFPFLLIPVTVNEEFSDILRGYILQRFAWGHQGAVFYVSSNIYRNSSSFLNSNKFIQDKNLLYKIDILIDILNTKIISEITDSIELLIIIVEKLVKEGILGEKDLIIYKTYIKDLLNSGYNNSHKFIKETNFKEIELMKIYSELNIYMPSDPIILMKNKIINNNIKIINHYNSNKIYNDILLIINYNNKGYFQKINNYIISLYKEYFYNIAIIVPDDINDNNSNSSIFTCNYSFYGYYSYACIKKIIKNFQDIKDIYLLMMIII